jgi:hypothetical protein
MAFQKKNDKTPESATSLCPVYLPLLKPLPLSALPPREPVSEEEPACGCGWVGGGGGGLCVDVCVCARAWATSCYCFPAELKLVIALTTASPRKQASARHQRTRKRHVA